MLTFLQPAALWAMGAMAIPIAIHLWNRRQGKVLDVGSISLIIASERQQARRIRLQDTWLLLLRCLLVAIAAFWLAKPQWLHTPLATEQKGWLLVPPGQLTTAYRQHQTTIDTLLQAGYQFHYFEEGFAEAPFKEALTDTMKPAQPRANHWQTLQQLNNVVPPGVPVYLFTDNQLLHFSGIRPTTHLNLRWALVSSNDSVANYLQSAYADNTGNLRATIVHSRNSGNSVVAYNFAPGTLPNGFVLGNDGGMLLQYTDSLGHASRVPVDTTTQHVAVNAGNHPADGGYLQAALHALRDVYGRRLYITIAKQPGSLPATCDWLFWLTDQPLPTGVNAANIVAYAQEKAAAQRSVVMLPGHNGMQPPELYQSVQAGIDTMWQALWHDGFGRPLLAQTGNKHRYTLYTHLNPSYTALVWSAQFPEALYTLLYGAAPLNVHPLDKRIIAASQVQPMAAAATTPQTLPAATKPLNHWFWWALLVCMAAERLVANGRKKEVAHG